MAKVFTVKFYWKGHEYIIHQETQDSPDDESIAINLAWGAIRKWFEDQNLSIPEQVRNINYYEGKAYHWSVLPMSTSSDCIK